jgi:hypothetical protein
MSCVRSLLILVFVTGCFGHGASEKGLNGDDNNPAPGGGSGAPCFTDMDCVAAAPSCCACPTFATSAGDPKVEACGQVDCPPSTCPDNVEAACDTSVGACVLQCKPLECAADISCPDGFARDASGCLSCQCAEPGQVGTDCAADMECVETRGDCCGCMLGGFDTAVPARDASQFDSSLMCGSSPACPGVDTCDPANAPHCAQGVCALGPAKPADACGESGLPACGAGTACVVNASDQANLYGLGVCRAM